MLKMRFSLHYLLVAAFVFAGFAADADIYGMQVTTLEGKRITLEAFKHKPIWIVVNVASQCGYTHTNYVQLQALYERFKDKVEILAFPCNQFGAQEPGSHNEIRQFTSERYGVEFPLFSKVNVNGKEEHPLFRYLKTATPDSYGYDIQWNFTKFLLVNGVPRKRYPHNSNPSIIEPDIVAALDSLSTQEL